MKELVIFLAVAAFAAVLIWRWRVGHKNVVRLIAEARAHQPAETAGVDDLTARSSTPAPNHGRHREDVLLAEITRIWTDAELAAFAQALDENRASRDG